MNSLHILKALLRKELLLIRRNPFIPRVMIMLPLMVTLVVPLVANMDVKNVGVAVIDNDRSQLSRRIIIEIDASKELSIAGVCADHTEGMRLIENGSADVLLSVPQHYARDLRLGKAIPVDVEANGVNATKGSLGAQYASGSVMQTVAAWLQEQGIMQTPEQIYISNRYNPTLDYHNYMIPALMVMLVIIICGFLPALNIVGEKESGTIEAMNVTPVGKTVFVLSKLIPYWVAGMIVVAIGMTVGWLVYGLVPSGAIPVIFAAAILFSLIMSALGVTIANQSSTILQSIFVMFAVIIVFQLMSGLFTPISSMPGWAQCITYIVPPRYFIEIMRAVYLRGTPISDLWPQFSALAAFAIVFGSIAAITYKKQI